MNLSLLSNRQGNLVSSVTWVVRARRRSRKPATRYGMHYQPILPYGEPLPPPLPEKDEISGWTKKSKRVGCIGVKAGMTTVWNEYNEAIPLTILQIQNCQVVDVKDSVHDPTVALQVGAAWKHPKNIKKPQQGLFAKAGVPPKKWLNSFEVTKDALLPAGTNITARHFLPGQRIDVRGKAKGHGFTGVMKRWGFAGQPASHGTSKAHRSLGSTGQCQDPGRTFKGKKMAGRMGGKERWQLNLFVYKVDVRENVVLVAGTVPGQKGARILMRDALGFNFMKPPPFPTYKSDPAVPEPEELVAVMRKRPLTGMKADFMEEQQRIKDQEAEKEIELAETKELAAQKKRDRVAKSKQKYEEKQKLKKESQNEETQQNVESDPTNNENSDPQ